MTLLVRNASQIVTCAGNAPRTGREQGELGIVDGGVAINGDKIVAVGPDALATAADEVVDANGGVVLPGFVDCHTHAVFIGSRAG